MDRIAGGFRQGLDVDAPAGQLGSQAGILSITADGKTELILANHHGGSAIAFHLGKVDTTHTGRADGLGNINNGILIPLDDIDLLVVQFLDDGLDANTLDPHAGTHRVHACLGGHHSDLGAGTRLAGDRPDLDHTMVDLRNFVLEQAAQEVAMGTRKHDLRTARAILHFQNDRTHTVMQLEALAGNSLVARQHAFRLHVKTDGGRLGIGRLDDAADDLTDLALEIRHLVGSLGLADALLDHLAGRLGGDAAKIGRGRLDDNHIAQLGFRVDLARFLQKDLGLRLLYVLDNFLFSENHDFTGVGIDFGFHMLCRGRVDSPPVG